MSSRAPWFVRGDLDGLFGLFLDNLVQLLLIPVLCMGLCGMTGENSRLIYAHILPGAALSIVVGNIFYAWQARRLAARTGRSDVTALPYGINTPSMLVYLIFVMAPAYARTQDAVFAWKMGLVACLGSGIIEFLGAFVAEWVRRRTPRAALLSTLSGIAVTFISMQFALAIFSKPLIAMLPMAILFVTLFARVGFPLRLPGGLVAVLLGTLAAWLLPVSWTGSEVGWEKLQTALSQQGFYLPIFSGHELWQVVQNSSDWIGFISVIIPMGLFNVIGSLQNIESAEAAGDSFDTRSSLAVNGIGTIIAALFGSCFPTTIYIGHAGWKTLGARTGYSTANGLLIALIGLTGWIGVLGSIVPVEAGMPIVLWVGIIITAQAFQTTPREHAPAVALGLFPALAAWGLNIVQGAFMVSGGKTIQDALTTVQPPFLRGLATEANGYLIHGMIVIERGYIFTCMSLAAIAASLVGRHFGRAALWSAVSALTTFIGLTHAYQVKGNDIDYLFNFDRLTGSSGPDPAVWAYRAEPIAIGYLLMSLVFLIFWQIGRKGSFVETGSHE